MTELNFEEISTVNGGSINGGEISWWDLDDFNRERMEQIMREYERRNRVYN